MKTSKSISVSYLLMKRNIITIGIIVTGLLSIIFTLLTYFGSYSGNFLVLIDNDRKSSITLSSTQDFENALPRLFADSRNDIEPINFMDLNLQAAVSTDGNYFDPDPFQYLAYTFYLKNNGNQVLDVDMKIIITEVLRHVDEIIRVIIIEDGDVDNLKYYMKKDKADYEYPGIYPNPIYFYDEDKGIVFSDLIKGFLPEEVRKYTIIIYSEGADPDSNDLMSYSMIKMIARFNVVDPINN